MRALTMTGLACAIAAIGALTATPAAAAAATPFALPATFEGTQPCADCPGIRTTLQLTSSSYVLTLHYLERKVADVVYKGPWTYVKSSSRIECKSPYGAPQYFQVVDSTTLRVMNRAGTGPATMAPNDLKLVTLAPNQWLLVELRGMPVEASAARQQISLSFAAPNQVSGSDGCNRLTGTYKNGPDYGLTFGPLATTKMFCEQGQSLSAAFDKALQSTTSYNFNGGTLNFYGGGWPLARFERVVATTLSH